MLYILYSIIILVIVLLFIIIKDKKELFNKLGKVSIISGIVLVVIAFTLYILFNIYVNKFNITKILLVIFNKFIYTSIFFIVIGVILIIISKLMKRKK